MRTIFAEYNPKRNSIEAALRRLMTHDFFYIPYKKCVALLVVFYPVRKPGSMRCEEHIVPYDGTGIQSQVN